MIRIPSGGGHAARRTAQVFGVLAGLGGLTHGVGEVIQGGVPVLAGGGIGPPVMGLLAGAIGRWASRSPRWVTRVDERLRRGLGRVWTPLFAVATANATFLVIGSLVLVYGFDVDRPELFERSFYAAALSLLALAATAPAADAEHRAAREEPVEPAPALLGASQGSV